MRVLVVEDEPRIAAFVARGLRAEGYQVDAVGDGESALAWVSRNRADLAVLDLLMPGMDGIDVVRELQRKVPEMPVIILSARRDVASKLSGLRAGAVDYLVKPFAFDELVERIRVQLRLRRSDLGGGQLRTRALALDMASRTVDVGDGPMRLSDQEAHVLEHLMRHAGQPVSRERLLSDVWGYSHAPRTNVVDVCVRRLRAKIGHDQIETIRGAGYAVRR